MIASIGDLAIDHYISSDKKILGGIAVNFAVQADRLAKKRGMRNSIDLYSVVGNDQNADFSLQSLRALGISTDHITQLSGLTAEQRIEVVGDERRFVGYTAGVLEDFRLSDDQLARLSKADSVVVPLSDGLKPVFEQVLGIQGPKKIVDFSRDADIPGFAHGDVIAMLEHYIDRVDTVFMGGDSAVERAVAEIAARHQEKLLVLTKGSEGARAFYHGHDYQQAAIPAKQVVDTTGCGDAFRAGFVVDYAQHGAIESALYTGAQIAAETAGHIGGFPLETQKREPRLPRRR